MTALGDDIAVLPVTELSARIAAKQLSPVDLTELYLARIDRIASKVNCVVTLTADLARAQAKEAAAEIAAGKRRGPLHGIPYGLKDLVDTAGIRTTWGAAPYRDRVPSADATVQERLRAAGAVLLGKLSMIELAGGMGYHYGDAAFNGACGTPWDPTKWAGGSSSGSASATAAGLVGFAIGSETWGSIVCPSSFCGTSGLRPTYGAVSRAGAMALSFTMDKLGPICRSVEDTRLVLAAIGGKDPRDPSTIDLPPLDDASAARAKGLRAAVVPLPKEGVQAPVKAAFEAAVAVLESAGVKTVEMDLPPFPFEALAGLILDAEVKAAFAELLASGRVKELSSRQKKDWTDDHTYAAATAVDFVRGMQQRRLAQEAMRTFFSSVDVIVWPGMPALAPPSHENFDATFAVPDPVGGMGNLCGLPAAVCPCGFASPTPGAPELPIGLQAVAAPNRESDALSVLMAYQSKTDWHTRRPPTG